MLAIPSTKYRRSFPLDLRVVLSDALRREISIVYSNGRQCIFTRVLPPHMRVGTTSPSDTCWTPFTVRLVRNHMIF
jgi:hypothetical protein